MLDGLDVTDAEALFQEEEVAFSPKPTAAKEDGLYADESGNADGAALLLLQTIATDGVYDGDSCDLLPTTPTPSSSPSDPTTTTTPTTPTTASLPHANVAAVDVNHAATSGADGVFDAVDAEADDAAAAADVAAADVAAVDAAVAADVDAAAALALANVVETLPNVQDLTQCTLQEAAEEESDLIRGLEHLQMKIKRLRGESNATGPMFARCSPPAPWLLPSTPRLLVRHRPDVRTVFAFCTLASAINP
jgi:hypothetical protein